MEVPNYCKDRPIFKGLIVPWVAHVNSDGTPDFRVLDPDKTLACAKQSLCGICGKALGTRVMFIGGELSTAHGNFADPLMHEQCARYAVSVCPYLIGKTDYAPLSRKTKDGDGDEINKVPGHVETRTSMSFTLCTSYLWTVQDGAILFKVPKPKWTEMFWEKPSE